MFEWEVEREFVIAQALNPWDDTEQFRSRRPECIALFPIVNWSCKTPSQSFDSSIVLMSTRQLWGHGHAASIAEVVQFG